MQRREFFINGLKIAGLTLAANAVGVALRPSISHAEERRRGGAAPDAGPELVNPKEATASAVGYVENAKKTPAAKGNSCANCQLFTNPQKLKGKAVGSCPIFQGKVVLANAYCNSWTKKA